MRTERAGPRGRRHTIPPQTPAAGLLAVLLLAPLVSVPALAQGAEKLDAGNFEIRLGERRVGTESFAIRREGNVIKAVGRRSLREEAADPFTPREVWLQTDRRILYELYLLRPRTDGERSIEAFRDGNRFRVYVKSPDGQRVKEFLGPRDLVVLEPTFAHHFVLLFQRPETRAEGGRTVSFPALIPSHTRTATLRIRAEEAGGDGAPAAGPGARSYRVELDGESYRVALDGSGRVVRVAPASGGWTLTRNGGG